MTKLDKHVVTLSHYVMAEKNQSLLQPISKSKFPGPGEHKFNNEFLLLLSHKMEQNWEMWMDPETIIQNYVRKVNIVCKHTCVE